MKIFNYSTFCVICINFIPLFAKFLPHMSFFAQYVIFCPVFKNFWNFYFLYVKGPEIGQVLTCCVIFLPFFPSFRSISRFSAFFSTLFILFTAFLMSSMGQVLTWFWGKFWHVPFLALYYTFYYIIFCFFYYYEKKN